MDIQALIGRWARAVREENRAGIRADHDSEMLMFDLPPPCLSRGLDAYLEDLGNVFVMVREVSRLTFTA
jgi:hypothetical protein